MSISRLIHELRPLFRLLEDPLMRAPISAYGLPSRFLPSDPFFTSLNAVHPALDLTEEGDNFIVEAELPGVKRDDIDIIVDDGGRSITIRGKKYSRRAANTFDSSAPQSSVSQGEGTGAVTDMSSETAPNQLTTERLYSGTSSFKRTVWLPQSINSSKITAKLTDGVLILRAPKMEDKESTKIKVESD